MQLIQLLLDPILVVRLQKTEAVNSRKNRSNIAFDVALSSFIH